MVGLYRKLSRNTLWLKLPVRRPRRREITPAIASAVRGRVAVWRRSQSSGANVHDLAGRILVRGPLRMATVAGVWRRSYCWRERAPGARFQGGAWRTPCARSVTPRFSCVGRNVARSLRWRPAGNGDLLQACGPRRHLAPSERRARAGTAGGWLQCLRQAKAGPTSCRVTKPKFPPSIGGK